MTPSPSRLRVPVPDETAAHDDEVRRVVDELDGLAERPVAEHVAVFEEVHAALSRALTDGPDGVDGAPAAAGGAPGRA